jgi:hypothetical protein
MVACLHLLVGLQASSVSLSDAAQDLLLVLRLRHQHLIWRAAQQLPLQVTPALQAFRLHACMHTSTHGFLARPVLLAAQTPNQATHTQTLSVQCRPAHSSCARGSPGQTRRLAPPLQPGQLRAPPCTWPVSKRRGGGGRDRGGPRYSGSNDWLLLAPRAVALPAHAHNARSRHAPPPPPSRSVPPARCAAPHAAAASLPLREHVGEVVSQSLHPHSAGGWGRLRVTDSTCAGRGRYGTQHHDTAPDLAGGWLA